MHAFVVVTLLVLALAAPAFAQSRDLTLSSARTLRQALERSGFDDAILASDGPPLDRQLTSWDGGVSADIFVAGYYFEDELNGPSLTRLHVSLFDRLRRKWPHRHDLGEEIENRGLMIGGSVIGVTVHPRVVVLGTHASPSAGFAIVLDRSLKLVASLPGYHARVMTDGSVLYGGNLVHFSPFHQETLKLFDLDRRTNVDVFPGTTLSPLAAAYKREVTRVYATVKGSPPPHLAGFDRSIDRVEVRGSSRIDFVVRYYVGDYPRSDRGPFSSLTTVVRCQRLPSRAWSCTEREIER